MNKSTVQDWRKAGYSWERCFDPTPLPKGNRLGQGRNTNHVWRKWAAKELTIREARASG